MSGGLVSGGLEARATDFGSGEALFVWGSSVWGSRVWGSRVWGSRVWGSRGLESPRHGFRSWRSTWGFLKKRYRGPLFPLRSLCLGKNQKNRHMEIHGIRNGAEHEGDGCPLAMFPIGSCHHKFVRR